MGLDKFIVNQVINMAEDSAKVQDALDVMEDKLEAEVLKLIEGSGINPLLLPFDPIKLIKGEETLDPTAILKPELLCLLPPLSAAQQSKSQNLIDNLKSTISSIIDNINSLKDALVTIQEPLITLEVTGNNLKETIQKISIAVKVIKAIPIPVAFGTPAVAIPVKVLTILSDILVQSDKIIIAGKGVTTLIPGLVNAVLPIITKTIAGVDMIIGKVEPILTILSFIQAKITLGDNCPNITQAEINGVQSDISTALQADIAALGDSSNPTINILNETELLNSLQPNSNPPFTYQDFTLILEFDPTNTFSFPRRRIRADRYFASETSTFFTLSPSSSRIELNGPIILYNDPGNLSRYSFASSTQILVQEMKYKIDQYLFGVVELVNVEEATDDVSRNDDSDDPPVDDIEIIPPFFITYEGTEEVSTLDNPLFGSITIPNPRTTSETSAVTIDYKIIEISMDQLGLTLIGDLNWSILSIYPPLNVDAGTISVGASINQPYEPIHVGWKKKLEYGINGFVITNDDYNEPVAITISTPGVYRFKIYIHTDSVGDVFSKISVKTQ